MAYDDQNIFAKILRKEIPCSKVYEDEHTFAFKDINPKAPVHLLVITKGPYVSLDDFSATASDAEQAAFCRAIGRVARDAGLAEGGYRVMANIGAHGRQEVQHLHLHILGGHDIGPMVTRLKN
ncbi:MAG: histidine triad nucleotide-binding protein [Rhodospirillales bacterium]|jgi:histidine triad (HIT) family protein